MPHLSVASRVGSVALRSAYRDPDAWLRAGAWLVVTFAAAQLLGMSFGRDQGIYAVVADGMLDGRMPYRDLWDFKPPGIFFVFALAQLLFDKSMLAIRLVEAMGLALAVLGMAKLGASMAGSRTAGLIGGALAALIHAQLDFWHTGQPEAFGGFLTVGALVAAMHEWPRRFRWTGWGIVGLCFGLAFLLKPHLGGGAVVVAAYLARRERAIRPGWWSLLSPFAVVGGLSMVPILGCVAWFALRDAWSALAWTLFEFAPGYTLLGWSGSSAPEMFYYAVQEGFFGFSAIPLVGAAAALGLPPLSSREREGIWVVLGILSVHFAGIAMQGKFFAYHYSASLPLVAFIAGVGLYKLWRRLLAAGGAGALVFLMFLFTVGSMRTAVRDTPGGFWYRSWLRVQHLMGYGPVTSRESLDRELSHVSDYSLYADRQVAHEIRQLTRADASLFVWGFEPAIYWLSERRPASRFIYDVPQRAKWQSERARAELMDDLGRDPPAMIVVQSNDAFPYVTGNRSDSRSALTEFAELRDLVTARYTWIDSVEDFRLYARHADQAPIGHDPNADAQ